MKVLPKSIQNIILKLQEAKVPIENHQLIKIVEKSGVLNSELLQFATFDHCKTESYGRNTLYKEESFGIYVMSWLPGDFTGIHSHGHSEWGIVYFMGDATHRTYTVKESKVELKTSEIMKKGGITPVCGDLVHAMGNLSDTPFITLHVYGSNNYIGQITEDSKLYEIEKNRIRTTFGTAFLNISDDLCKDTKQGIETCKRTRNDYKAIIERFYRRNNITI